MEAPDFWDNPERSQKMMKELSTLKEDCASTMSGQMYYYTIKDAIAMSSNLKRPLKKLSGTVIKVEPQISIYMVSVEIDEE